MCPLQNAGMPSFQYPGSLHRHSRPCGEDGGEAEPSAPVSPRGARPSRLRGQLFAVNPGEQYPWSGDPGGVRTRASERKGLSSRSRARKSNQHAFGLGLKKGDPPRFHARLSAAQPYRQLQAGKQAGHVKIEAPSVVRDRVLNFVLHSTAKSSPPFSSSPHRHRR